MESQHESADFFVSKKLLNARIQSSFLETKKQRSSVDFSQHVETGTRRSQFPFRNACIQVNFLEKTAKLFISLS